MQLQVDILGQQVYGAHKLQILQHYKVMPSMAILAAQEWTVTARPPKPRQCTQLGGAAACLVTCESTAQEGQQQLRLGSSPCIAATGCMPHMHDERMHNKSDTMGG